MYYPLQIKNRHFFAFDRQGRFETRHCDLFVSRGSFLIVTDHFSEGVFWTAVVRRLHFPPDVAKLIQEQLSAGYASTDDVLRDALQVFRGVQSRNDEFIADVKIGIEQANQGQVGPLDVDSLIESRTGQLAEEGISD